MVGTAGSKTADAMDVRFLCLFRFVCVRGFCDGLITCSEEAKPGVCVCDLETSIMRQPKPELGCNTTGYVYIKNICVYIYTATYTHMNDNT